MSYDPISQAQDAILGEITAKNIANQQSLPRGTPRSIQRSAYDQTNPAGGRNLDYTTTAWYADQNYSALPAVPLAPTRLVSNSAPSWENFDGAKLAYYPLARRYGVVSPGPGEVYGNG